MSKNEKSLSPRGQMLLSMLIFGTVGLFVRHIPLPSALIACVRGVIGAVCILLFMRLRSRRLDGAAIRRNALMLLLSGAALGFNWAFLFEAYRHTSVATATLCYYLAPMLVVLLSPLLGEKLTARKIICCLVSLLGIVFVSGGTAGDASPGNPMTGIMWGVLSAVCYAGVMLFNKELRDITPYDRTVVQLGVSSVLMLIYAALSGQALAAELSPLQGALLITVGVVHTGVAYLCYFGALRHLKAQNAAILSYIDPVAAILLAWLVLGERLSAGGVLGAVLILGSAFISEMQPKDS